MSPSHRATDHLLNCAAALEAYDRDKHVDDINLVSRLERCAEWAGEPFAALVVDTDAWSKRLKKNRVDVAHHLGGYRGHPITKSRRFSVNFGRLRRARRAFRSRGAALAPNADVRLVLDVDDDVPEGFEVVSSFAFVGQGYLDLDEAAAAVRSAAMARIP